MMTNSNKLFAHRHRLSSALVNLNDGFSVVAPINYIKLRSTFIMFKIETYLNQTLLEVRQKDVLVMVI